MIDQPEPSRIIERWTREFDRNTGNWNSMPYYVVVERDDTEYETHTVRNEWLHLIVVDTKK